MRQIVSVGQKVIITVKEKSIRKKLEAVVVDQSDHVLAVRDENDFPRLVSVFDVVEFIKEEDPVVEEEKEVSAEVESLIVLPPQEIPTMEKEISREETINSESREYKIINYGNGSVRVRRSIFMDNLI
jgi:hypothetical protein